MIYLSTPMAKWMNVLTASITIMVWSGCGKKPAEQGATGGAQPADNADVAKGDESADDPGLNDPIAPEMFEQLRSMMSMQVEAAATQAETLRKAAAEYSDAQLNDLLKQMDAKVAEARKTMASITSPVKDAKALRVDVPNQITEAMQLAGKATDRLQAVLREASGLSKPS